MCGLLPSVTGPRDLSFAVATTAADLHFVRGEGCFWSPRGMRLPETERIHYILKSKAYGHSMSGDEIAERASTLQHA